MQGCRLSWINSIRNQAANVWAGVPVDRISVGMTAIEAMLQATAADRPPRRRSMLEEALGGESMTYHSIQSMPDAS